MGIVARLKQQLFRWQSDGTAPLRLGQRRIFIIPTRGGLLFALALLVMLLGAINYTLALGHALVFLLGGLGIIGMVHTFRNLHALLISPGRCEPVFCGETAHFQITLSNDRSTPRLALELEAEPGQAVIVAVNAQDSTKIGIPLNTRRRGWLELPRVRLATRYPLGLFVAWCYLQPAMRCLVYPAPLASPLPPPSPTPAGGERSGDGGQEDFAGFRERQPADSPRHVAWKASARDAGERPLLVKQFAGGGQVELQLDWVLTDPAQPVEIRLSQLTGWVCAAEAEGCGYNLRLPGLEIPPGCGVAHRRRCLEALALWQP
ncbi:DUF58 domain-containing protein [Dechloromonas denitrificans]|uniref:DUF58 domain-containing protein n=1 Tax=Dechloromonas denitrificans TaxID=281362 RepID=UPI001CF91259|nr:DUF58 domain-containing protein [Dechloromonas denitrificans]UCV05319.1 DUF58 domain-containing protein [Dechloromonas denitrificans]